MTDTAGEHRLEDLLQAAIFGPTVEPWTTSARIDFEGFRRSVESAASAPYPDYLPGSALNPVHPADAEAARRWHGLPEGKVVTQHQYWEYLIGVPRT